MKKIWLIGVVAVLVFVESVWLWTSKDSGEVESVESTALTDNESGYDAGSGLDLEKGEFLVDEHPLSIEYMRKQDYPGSEIVIEQELSPGSNYARYVVSYKSEGLTQYAMLTVPNGCQNSTLQESRTLCPAIVFNHGYISPSVYRTTERYVAYVDGFARSGYVVLKPDYRGHGNSEGRAEGGYGSPDYTIDVLNAFSSLQKYPDVDPDRIGMWGHSMGGHITLRAMVIDPDIKAGVIWGGVVGSYQDYQELWWNRREHRHPSPSPGQRGYWRRSLYEQYGTFDENPEFWASISATNFLGDLSGPIQLHHAEGDASVPYQLAENFYNLMTEKGLEVDWNLYPGDDHNISANFGKAMRRSVEWFDRYVKGG